jgi:hypothetical protein
MENVTLEHPEYRKRKAVWRRYWDLYAGGETIREHAGEYLMRRQKEPLEVYSERLSRVFYENYAGSIIDWYGATLFRREPVMQFTGGAERDRTFFHRFTEDCDLRGTAFTDFFRHQFVNALVFGSSYALVDFPRVEGKAVNRAEEDASGASRAYLVSYTPEHLINWRTDEHGLLEWAVLRSSQLKESNGGAWVEETTWVSYDREEYRIYRSQPKEGASTEPVLIRKGRHALADTGVVPLIETRLPEGLWLMNKAALLQLEHFNKSNALAWAIHMGLFAMPVVYSDKEWDSMVGESYFVQMGPNDRFGWTEPEGKVFQIAADNLARLKDEIYRICYLLNQASSSESSATQSGLSKLRDYAITQEVLRAFGDFAKDSMKRVLRAVAAARRDQVQVEITGLDEFDIADFSTDLENATQLLALGIQSPTLKQQIHTRLAQKYLCDARQEVKDQVAAEIQANAWE